jgi:hypothetical protein
MPPGYRNPIKAPGLQNCTSDTWGNKFVPWGPPPNRNKINLISITQTIAIDKCPEGLFFREKTGKKAKTAYKKYRVRKTDT